MQTRRRRLTRSGADAPVAAGLHGGLGLCGVPVLENGGGEAGESNDQWSRGWRDWGRLGVSLVRAAG